MEADCFSLLYTTLCCLLVGLICWSVVEIILIIRCFRRVALRMESLTELGTWTSFVRRTIQFFKN
jgi:hypothetical protein